MKKWAKAINKSTKPIQALPPLLNPYPDALITYLMFCNVDHQFSLHKLFQDVLWGKFN